MALVKMNNSPRLAHNNPFLGNPWADEFFRPFFADKNQAALTGVAANIAETADAFLIELAAPGLAKEDFKISLEKDVLGIKVAKEQSQDEKGPQYHRVEYSFKSFERAFKLPKTVDQAGIAARYENGVLYLNLPKKAVEQENTTKEIAVS